MDPGLDRPRPELVVRVDRSGLNEHHPLVIRLYAAIDRVLRPLVAAEERRAGAHLIGAPKAVSARDQVGLKALNDLLKAAFDQPGSAAVEPGANPAEKPPVHAGEPPEEDETEPPPSEQEEETEPLGELEDEAEPGEHPPVDGEPAPEVPPAAALWFKQSPIRLHPGEKRTITLLADPTRAAPGTPVELEADPGLAVVQARPELPAPGARGYSSLRAELRARVTVEPGLRLIVLAAAGEHTAELEVLIVRHRASGWVREIARKAEDQTIEAEFDPETGVVTVYEGRREFKDLERAARRAGYPKKRAPEYVPYRMLEVEAAANAVYAWAAEQILHRRLSEERPADPGDYAAAVRHQHQQLRHRAHAKLMQAFLEPEIFDGQVTVTRPHTKTRGRQLRLVPDDPA